MAIVVLVSAYAFLRFTRAGLVARGAMQNPTMAAALGIDTTRVYAITFGVGAALSGLAGAVLAPFAGVIPTMGLAYVAKAFITVISGGVAVLAGTSAAAALYGTVNQTVTFLTGPVTRRGGAPRHGIGPAPSDAAGDHEPAVPEGNVRQAWSLGAPALGGLALLVLSPLVFDLAGLFNITVYVIMGCWR